MGALWAASTAFGRVRLPLGRAGPPASGAGEVLGQFKRARADGSQRGDGSRVDRGRGAPWWRPRGVVVGDAPRRSADKPSHQRASCQPGRTWGRQTRRDRRAQLPARPSRIAIGPAYETDAIVGPSGELARAGHTQRRAEAMATCATRLGRKRCHNVRLVICVDEPGNGRGGDCLHAR